MPKAKKDIYLDRVVADDLVAALKPRAPLRLLVEYRNSDQAILNLQFRRPSGLMSRASLYAGLTRILDLDCRSRAGREAEFRFFVEHATHRKAAPLHQRWVEWTSVGKLSERWAEVVDYLDARRRWFESKPAVHHVIEGRVHAAMCSGSVSSYRVINQEASPSFRDQKTKDAICERIRDEMRRVLAALPEPKAWMKYKSFGTSPDMLAVDRRGRLIVAEAKPSRSSGIVKGPVQARFYGGLIYRWLESDPDAPYVLRKMLDQRIEVGLSKKMSSAGFRSDMPIVPVLAIGGGDPSKTALDHATDLRHALARLRPTEAGRVEPTEIWLLGPDGDVESRI